MSPRSPRGHCLLLAMVVALLVTPMAFGHIRIYPTESAYGAREKYTMRVPNERKSPTIRVEGEFPAGLEIYDFEFKPGWKIDFKKDDKGKIIGAVWTGRIDPYEFTEFGMLAINPKAGDPNLLWKFYQYYEDGFKEEFTNPPDAKMPLRPMPLVTLKPADVPASASPSSDANAQTGQEVLKINEACNAAELRADISAMDSCETEDFTHTHANGMVEHKAEYLKGVGSGAHKFLLLDLSDLQVRSYGTSAIVEGRIHLRANNSGKIADVNNHLMTVWVKQQGKWREAAWFAVGLPASGPSAVSEK